MRPSRWMLATAATIYAASLLLYSGLFSVWSSRSGVELGFSADYELARNDQLVTGIVPGSPAERTGIRPGDRIVAIDGVAYTDQGFQVRVWARHKPGDGIDLKIERPGQATPLHVAGVFRRSATSLNSQVNVFFPWPFVLVALVVLFLRLEDPSAWFLAILFGGVAVSPGWNLPAKPPAWWYAARTLQGTLVGMLGPLFYCFYARFPTRSPLDRRWPSLKWVCAGLGALLVAGSARTGSLGFPAPLAGWLGQPRSNRIALLLLVGCMALGLVSFAANFFGARLPETRRRMRVMFWGTTLSLGPNLVKLLIQNFTSIQMPDWLLAGLQILLLLTPAFFAYALVVHRVLEFPVLLRLGARYLLVQRGFTILLSLFSIGLTLLFASASAGYLHPASEVGSASGVAMGAMFGTALLWSGTQVHKRVGGRIDRAFFRSAYDARVILEDLAEQTRTAMDRTKLARLLEFHLNKALNPTFLKVESQPAAPALEELAECVIPILGRNGRELGSLLLGPRLSEEPYSGEDRRLLASVAGQTATALENMQLAEEIAERMEGDRRVAREMEIARDVQARLLPQSPPAMETLACAARCIQARAVGGDYYDFLDLGPRRTGLVLADVSGKGVHAALLVAHLQACVRTQCAVQPLPVLMLEQVNRMLYGSTAPQHFATLFFGSYDDESRELTYVNCGHNPPIVIGNEGGVTRLTATATILGAFARWEGSAGSLRLAPGDLLAVFSDGITEASHGDEEFGEERLIEELMARSGATAEAIADGVLRRVQEFGAGTQGDDLTLVVAQAR